MALDATQVRNIAELVRLQIDDSEIAAYQQNLDNIISMVETLADASISDVEPLANPLEGVQRLRADIVTETNQRDRLQATALATEAGYYLVPRVVE